jgi:hypothetical protein
MSMGFRARVISLCAAIVLLTASLVLGILFSPERVQARGTGKPLIEKGLRVEGIDIVSKAEARAILRRRAEGWEAQAGGGRVYPASGERLAIFLRQLAGLTQGRLASRDSAHFGELGLGEDALRLALRLAGPKAAGTERQVTLLVGKRGPSGDEDYVMVEGENTAYLVRGSLSFFLAQDKSYWYELHVLPDDVQGNTIATITIAPISGPYTLSRKSGTQGAPWALEGDAAPINQMAAGAMANALANLEGEGFADPAPADATKAAAGAGRLAIEVTTHEGKKYSLSLRPGPESGKLLVTTSWSPWTYTVDESQLRRAVLPLANLRSR